jgi:hypothetical protein
MKSSFNSLVPFLPIFYNCQLNSKLISWQAGVSKLDFTLLDYSLNLMLRQTVSRPVYPGIKHPSGAYDQIFITLWQLRFCCGAPSLTRGRVRLLYMLLALASAVLLVSKAHILLSQIWDFPFRRLLRLAGSRWRYSTPPPHGCLDDWVWVCVWVLCYDRQSVGQFVLE